MSFNLERAAQRQRGRDGMSEGRGTGRTTEQMRAAPEGAIYVWVNSVLAYPKGLAHHLGRSDLEVVPESWLEPKRVRGLTRPVVLDHALKIARPDQRGALSYLQRRGLAP